MIQGGDPKGDGTGGSDSTIQGEFSKNGIENPISHTRGTISMARAQIWTVLAPSFSLCSRISTYLDGSYAGFGHVTEGMDIVDAICKDAQPEDSNGTISAEQQPVIESITILSE